MTAEPRIDISLQAPVAVGDIVGLAREAERLGFARFLVPDHPGAQSDPFVALAAAAGSTADIGLGTYVLNAGLREPWQVATAAATLDQLSQGRFILGLGAGHTPSEWGLVGRQRPSAAERVGRLEEFIGIVTRLLAGECVTFDGEYLKVDRAEIAPALLPQRRVPLIVGGNGSRLLRLAGETADTVSVTGLGRTLADGHTHEVRWSPSEVEERVREVVRGAAGRKAPPVVEALVQHLELTDDRLGAARRFVDETPDLDLDAALDTPFALFGTPRDVARQLRGWEQRLGIRSWVVRPDVMKSAAAVMQALS